MKPQFKPEEIYLDLSKLNEEQQRKVIALLPEPRIRNDYSITNNYKYLHLNMSIQWFVDSEKMNKTELTYSQFLDMMGETSGENTEDNETNFLKYIANQRNEFARFVVLNYDVSGHLKLRTEIDSLLIAYDQMANKLKNEQAPTSEEVLQVDIYSGELNTERILTYKKLSEQYNIEESTVRDIFNAGADWVNKLKFK